MAEALERARLLLDLERYAAAIEAVTLHLAGHPTDAPALCLLARCHQGLSQPAAMLDAAERACAADPRVEWAHRLRAHALMLLERNEEAVAAAREAVRLAPDLWQSNATLACALSGVPGRRRAPFTAADEAVRLAPEEADAHYLRGVVYHANERVGRARRSYRHALRLDPHHAGAMVRLGRIAERRSQLGTSLRYFATAAATAPTETAGAVHVRRVLLQMLGMAWATAAMLTMVLLFALFPVAWLVAAAVAAGYAVWAWRAWRVLPARTRPIVRSWLTTDPPLLVRAVSAGGMLAVAVGIGVTVAVVGDPDGGPGQGRLVLVLVGVAVAAMLASAGAVVTTDVRTRRRDRLAAADPDDPEPGSGVSARYWVRACWASCLAAAVGWLCAVAGVAWTPRALVGALALSCYANYHLWMHRRTRRRWRYPVRPFWTRLHRLTRPCAAATAAGLLYVVAVAALPDPAPLGTLLALPVVLVPLALTLQFVRLLSRVFAGKASHDHRDARSGCRPRQEDHGQEPVTAPGAARPPGP